MAAAGEAGAGEGKTFYPPEELSKKAYIKTYDEYKELHRRSIEDPDGFWGEMAESLDWFGKWDTVFTWDEKECKQTWFAGGKINVSYNCLDRHCKTGKQDKIAIVWEPDEPGPSRTFT